MLVPVEWLNDYVKFDLPTEALAELFTMAGLEVEAVDASSIGDVLDIKVTPNRGDCLSIVGLAREIIAKMGEGCEPTPLWTEFQCGFRQNESLDPEETRKYASVEILDADLCPRYAARIIPNVKIAPSPVKVQLRLEAAGLRSINNIVDVTNYVLLELGQPLHSFDYDKLNGRKIIVRQAKPAEHIITLDGTEREVSPPMLVIADENEPVACAGIMGGGPTEVTPSTNTILLETAHFNPLSIRRTRKALGMNTESSYRFERFVDPELVVAASFRACQLLQNWSGITAVPGILDLYPKPIQLRSIEMRMDRCDLLLGMKVEPEKAVAYLERLGLTVSLSSERRFTVTVPQYRQDIKREDDLVEEVGRIHGYENIPEALPYGVSLQGKDSPEGSFAERIRSALLRCGLSEMVNHSLRAISPLDDHNADIVELKNAMSPEISILRSSILPGLVDAARRNIRRGISDIAVFEIGHVFSKDKETLGIAVFITGSSANLHWLNGRTGRDYDFFDVKGIIERMLNAQGLDDVEWLPCKDARLHPGRCAKIVAGDELLGYAGEIHPDLQAELDLPKRAYAAEMNFDVLRKTARLERIYKTVPRYPSAKRDIAVVIDQSIAWKNIESHLYEASCSLLEEARLFDIYSGKGIPDGKHSLAISLTLRKADGVLSDEEIQTAVSSVLRRLHDELGAEQRS